MGKLRAQVKGAMLLLNPTDVFRLIAFTWVGSAASPLGLATVSPPFSAAVLVSVIVLWTLVALWLSDRLVQRRLATDPLI